MFVEVKVLFNSQIDFQFFFKCRIMLSNSRRKQSIYPSFDHYSVACFECERGVASPVREAQCSPRPL